MKTQKFYVLFLLLFVAFLSACGSSLVTQVPEGRQQPPTSLDPELQDINGVGELKTIFNQDSGKARLVLLLSPT